MEGATFVDGQVILPAWVHERHLPSICASIGGKVAKKKVHCMYRLACLCKAFKELLCTGAPSLHTSLHNLGACTVSQREVRATLMERRSIAFHLWRYILGPRQKATSVQGWEKDITYFLASNGQVPYCEYVAFLRFPKAILQTMVQGASSLDVSNILAEVNLIAAQRYAQNMQHATFMEQIQELSGRFLGLVTQYRKGQNAVVNSVDIMRDFYVQYFATNLTEDEVKRMDVLSVNLGVTAHKGAKEAGGEKKTELHQSFIVNGWYLRVIVTQHHVEGEEEPGLVPSKRAIEVCADDASEMDRIVYLVNKKIPIIKVHICNLERKTIEDDVECDRQLVIKNTVHSDEESLTRERTEVTLTFRPEDTQEIICNIDELYPWLPEETKTAVLRVVLRPT